MRSTFLLFLLLLRLGPAHAAEAADALAQRFLHPPESARPWAYLFVMDGHFTKAGITADLEAMRRAGLGGFIFMEVDAGVPKGPMKFMSPEWQELFVHMVREAERLGLQVTLNAGPGWTGSGGPWVRPEQSMQHLSGATIELTGPTNFSGVLPKPKRRPAFFGDGGLPPELEKAKDEFYVDEALLAFPSANTNESIPSLEEKALYVRAPYSSQPGVKPFLTTDSHFAETPPGAAVDPSQVIDLTDRLTPEGRLDWAVPPGRWTLVRLGRTCTGANTRPAPAAGIGLESDKLDRAALEAHFESFVMPLLRRLEPRRTDVGWTSLHIDSWEMGAQNWTQEFRSEFKRRRGYDCTPYLPAFTGQVVNSLGASERFLWDVRQTCQELVIENHAEHLKQLGRRHGLGLSIEPYDMNPCSDLSLGGVADTPMCEFWLHGFDSTFSVFEATSIAHTLGRPIVAAESFTSNEEDRWLAHPASIKFLGDWALSRGVNRIVFHRYQHQPWLDRVPGMTMGSIGVHWERTQTWWEMAGGYHQYLARCQALLREGVPVADVCFLVAEGAPQVFRPPNSAVRGSPPDPVSYNFDACAPETVLRDMTFRDRRLQLPSGASYAVLVLPNLNTMTPALLKKINDLVDSGATILGRPPKASPSLSGFPSCDEKVQTLARRLWGAQESENGTIRRVGRGRVVWHTLPDNGPAYGQANSPINEPRQYGDFSTVERVLREARVLPDLETTAPLRYAHRRLPGAAEVYFVANRDPQPVEADCVFRVNSLPAELWDPVTGQRFAPQWTRTRDGRTALKIRFAPHQSWFVVFRKSAAAPDRSPSTEKHQALELQNDWEVTFQLRKTDPLRVTLDSLQDWTLSNQEAIRHHSGTALYRKGFAFPRKDLPASARMFLELGTVKNVASVRLNGRELGVVWCAPWEVEVTGALQEGDNVLEITVANLWPNRLIRDSGLPESERVTWTTWNPFKPGDPLLESGLIGPVRLVWTK